MKIYHAERHPKDGENRRTHAAKEGSESTGLCVAKLGAVVDQDGHAEQVTCWECRVKLRDDGALPMTPRALARRGGS